MQQILDYFNQLNGLANQGAPIDWHRAANQMAVMVAQEMEKAKAASDGPKPD